MATNFSKESPECYQPEDYNKYNIKEISKFGYSAALDQSSKKLKKHFLKNIVKFRKYTFF